MPAIARTLYELDTLVGSEEFSVFANLVCSYVCSQELCAVPLHDVMYRISSNLSSGQDSQKQRQ